MKRGKVRREFGVRRSQPLPCLTVFNLTGPLQFFISVCTSYRGNPEIDRFSTSSSSSPSFNFPLLYTTISSFTGPMQANSPFSAPPRSGTFKSPRASLHTEHSFTLEVQWFFFAAGLDIADTSRSDAKTVGLATGVRNSQSSGASNEVDLYPSEANFLPLPQKHQRL